ncbi:hypothetical protein CSA56_13220 [candidate division KSB3 bacterium]|uniref:Uncharacterized protein n=1 Tax=candidate division KSB3 bacterium TaxID=2044937 RepID=A0A2G6KCB4_9BACT|nr:MAG: hypothetical protein CSA56_13220 [candidate division KSB3 bacterium]
MSRVFKKREELKSDEKNFLSKNLLTREELLERNNKNLKYKPHCQLSIADCSLSIGSFKGVVMSGVHPAS